MRCNEGPRRGGVRKEGVLRSGRERSYTESKEAVIDSSEECIFFLIWWIKMKSFIKLCHDGCHSRWTTVEGWSIRITTGGTVIKYWSILKYLVGELWDVASSSRIRHRRRKIFFSRPSFCFSLTDRPFLRSIDLGLYLTDSGISKQDLEPYRGPRPNSISSHSRKDWTLTANA